MSFESKRPEQVGVFDEITSLGDKYQLTTSRFFQVLEQFEANEIISKEDLMKILIGTDYDTLPDSKKNLIWSIIDPDVEQAIELRKLRKEGENFEILNKAVQ